MILYRATTKRTGRNVNMNRKQSKHSMKPNTINCKKEKKKIGLIIKSSCYDELGKDLYI